MAFPPRDTPPTMMPAGIVAPAMMAPAGLRVEESRRPPPLPQGAILQIEESPDGVTVDGDGNILIETEDGGVIIDLGGNSNVRDPEAAKEFNANLADHIDQMELGRIAGDLIQGIQLDEQSRREWLDTRAQGIRILGLKIEPPRSSIETSTAMEGMSNVRHPLLLEATLRFQANARGELLPAAGPVKVMDKLGDQKDELAEQLENDMNYYLTTVATEYYPDTDRALFYTGFGGCSFKKVYNCPLRNRPVSESVDAKDLVVSNAATDLKNSARVTHIIPMRQSVLKRMQIAGAYRDLPIPTPAGVVLNPVDQQIANTQGIDPNTTQQQEDREHTIFEVYCELNIKGFEDKDEKGNLTGLPLPYRVAIDKDSQQVLEVRRNWREDDPTKMPKICFVKYPYVPGLGFYDIGLIHILGNTTNALTASWRELIDLGMFNNFPGFLYAKEVGRQNTNEFRIPPGGGHGLDTNGQKIGDAVMPLPYKDISPTFVQFITHIAETGQRLGGASEVQVAEGRQDAPVGTTLALIEQATKVEGAVHKRLHAAQAEEFRLLKECFRENPQSFIDALNARGGNDGGGWDEDTFLQALDDNSLVPMADPNTPSHMHRLMKAMAVVQLDKAYPGVMDPTQIVDRVLNMIGMGDIESLLAPPQAGGQIPPELQVEMATLADKAEQRQHQTQLQTLKAQDNRAAEAHASNLQRQESTDQIAERQSRERVAAIGLQGTVVQAHADLQTEDIKADAVDRSADSAETVAKLSAETAKANARKVAAKPKPKGK